MINLLRRLFNLDKRLHKKKSNWKRCNPPNWVIQNFHKMPLLANGKYYVKGKHFAYKGIFYTGRVQGDTRWYYYKKRLRD